MRPALQDPSSAQAHVVVAIRFLASSLVRGAMADSGFASEFLAQMNDAKAEPEARPRRACAADTATDTPRTKRMKIGGVRTGWDEVPRDLANWPMQRCPQGSWLQCKANCGKDGLGTLMELKAAFRFRYIRLESHIRQVHDESSPEALEKAALEKAKAEVLSRHRLFSAPHP